MPRYREIYRLSVTCTFLDRPKPPFAPTFFSPPITRTSIRRLAPQHQILYIPLEKRSLKIALRYFINHPLNRAQFPPRLIDFSKITETKTSPKKRGREREREREKKEGYNRHTIHELWRQFRTRSRPTGRKPRTLRPPRIPPYRVATP